MDGSIMNIPIKFLIIILLSLSVPAVTAASEDSLIAAGSDAETVVIEPESRLPGYEKLTYQIKWLGMPVGTMVTSINGIKEINGVKAYHLEVIVKTRGAINLIFKINDRFVSYMDIENLCTLRHEVYRRDGFFRKEAITDFDQLNNKAHFKNLLTKTEKTFDVPAQVHDILSACYYFMLLPLNVGERIQYAVSNNEMNYQLYGLIESKTCVTLPGIGKKDAILIRPYATLHGQKVDKGRVTSYFSCDKRRIPLFAIIKGPVFTELAVYLKKYEQH
jgi:hypothetical protein